MTKTNLRIILLLLFAMLKYWKGENDWYTYQFLDYGHCFDCHVSWETWDSYSQWKTCKDNYTFNSKILLGI